MVKSLMKTLGCCTALLLFLAGCAEPLNIAEALQLKEGEKIYTACNLWYEDPENIDCRNIQKGTFLPVGTEIVPLEECSVEQIAFKDKKGKKYVIRFREDDRLCTAADYAGYTFTVKSRAEQLKNIPKAVQTRILRGEVVPGMNTAQVQLAYGLPPAVRTPDLRNESWLYFINDSDTVRVVFRGGIVRSVLNFNETK